MSAQLAHAQRSEPVDFVGIALIAYIAFKGNLVLYFNGRLPVAGTTRPPAVNQAPLGPRYVVPAELAGRQVLTELAGRQVLTELELGR